MTILLTSKVESEWQVIGSIFQDETLLEDCFLLTEHFVEKKHQVIFEIMRSLQESKTPVDLSTVTNELVERDQINFITVSELTEIVNSVASLASFDFHQKQVLEAWKERRAQTLLKNALDHHKLKGDDLQTLIQSLNDIDDNAAEDEFDLKNRLVDLMELPFLERPEGLSGVRSGINALDNLTDGWQNQELIIIGARPSVGKTAFSLTLSLKASTDNTIVTYFSIEMSADALLKRLICTIAGIDGMKARNPYHSLNDEEKQAWYKAAGIVGQTNMQIFDQSKQTVNFMRAKLRKIQKKHPDKKHLVIIDYLTKIDSPNNHQSNHTKFTEISADLKAMAKDFNLPVICLAQLSRGVEQRNNKRPLMSDLRESGSIEQDADVIGFLFREDYQEQTDQQAVQEIELNITKQRNGPLGLVKMHFDKTTGRFMGVDQ